MDDYKFLFKVVLVGNAGVGKTCLVRRFTQGLFPPGQGATIGVDFMIKTVEIENEKVKLQIWDTAGQERFRSITQSYYRSAHALILVYDISCQPTFDCLNDWLREIQEYASNKVLRILVGNKIDREDREIPTHVGEDFAQRNSMYFIETSAKEAENVEKLFMEIAAELREQAKSKELVRYDTGSTNLHSKTTTRHRKKIPYCPKNWEVLEIALLGTARFLRGCIGITKSAPQKTGGILGQISERNNWLANLTVEDDDNNNNNHQQ